MDNFFEKQIKENIERNIILIDGFRISMVKEKLSNKTINKHSNNVYVYINEFLNYEKKASLAEDGYKEVSYFLEEWYYRLYRVSKSQIKSNITSIKKFYKYLLSIKKINKENYNELLEIIKDNKENWILKAERSNESSIWNFWDEVMKKQLIKLYFEAEKFVNKKSWENIDAVDILSIKFEGDDVIYFCSIFGRNNKEFGLAVYEGVSGLAGFFEILREEYDYIEEINNLITGLMMFLGNANNLEENDYIQIENSGVEFKNKKLLPQFRRYNPGYFPSEFELEDIEVFTRILKVINDFSSYISSSKFQSGLLEFGKCYFLDVNRNNECVINQYEISEIHDKYDDGEFIRIGYNEMDLKRLKKECRKSSSVWEMDAFYSLYPVKEKNEFFPVFFLVVDQVRDEIVGSCIVKPMEEDIEIQRYLLNLIKKIKKYPRKIILKNIKMDTYLSDIFKTLDIEIEIVENFRYLTNIKKEILKIEE